MRNRKHLLLLLATLLVPAAGCAQSDVEYLMEAGVGGGVVGYLGDFNSSFTKNLQPVASLVVRRNLNPSMALRANLSYGKLKGSSTDVTTYYPDYADAPYAFDNQMGDLSVVFEYNFWPYGTGRDYRGAKRIAPFVFLGVGGTYAKTSEKSVFTGNVPIGLGVKYKIGERLNVGLEWAMHFSLSDKLDGVEDPYGIESSGLFKNTDCYHALQLTLTYSFMAKCNTCHNEDE